MIIKPKILIFGAGSIGIFLGVKLYSKGYNVTLYGRKKLKNIHETILINGKVYKTPPRIYHLDKINDENYDILFVTTKLYDSQKSIEIIKKLKIKPRILAFVQNGLVEDNFYQGLEKYQGFLTISIFEGYRLIENQLVATKSRLGWQTDYNKLGQEVCKYLNDAGINCFASPDLLSLRAEKMLFVSAAGALSAIKKMTLGELIKNKEARQEMELILEEGFNTLKHEYNLPPLNQIKKRFYQTLSSVGNHYSSMYQDLASGRKTEIEFLNGLIVKLGKRKGISTPVNQNIYNQIKKLV